MSETNTFKFGARERQWSLFLVIAGFFSVVLGFIFTPQRTWANLLLNNYYFVGLSVMGTFFLAVHYVAGAKWMIAIKRIPEAISSFLPVVAILMLCLVFGLHSLYHWAHHEEVLKDAILLEKSGYLNVTYFMIRMVVFLGLWIFFSRLLRQTSWQQNLTGGTAPLKKCVVYSCFFIIVFAYSFSLAGFDWIMSTEPHWFSTMFAVFLFSGAFVNGLVVITLMVILLKERGFLQEVHEDHLHDLGKLIFAFSCFWAYIWFCQMMLIWYGNIPEETIYYVKRLHGDWSWLFYANIVFNWVVPFFVLLPRASKRSPALLKRVCYFLLFAHWFDLFLMIMPGILHDHASIGFLEVGISLGYAGLFISVVGRTLEKTSLVPVKDPGLHESLHYHNVP